MYGDGGWMGIGMWIFWVVLIVVVVLLVRTVVGGRTSLPSPHQETSPGYPQGTLRAR